MELAARLVVTSIPLVSLRRISGQICLLRLTVLSLPDSFQLSVSQLVVAILPLLSEGKGCRVYDIDIAVYWGL